ncbi:MucBP domain-containing protein [Lactococcus lactis]|uniref:MucBP domain-containing protein n=1 Tax=Lactococcus lactis TaxID=1358 RepID=UPI0020738D0A|nr:MucBP domain-containing protein [Lactococcus lactis]MCM6842398.1 MucBP domain-containing protein [Lactococcus lactis]MCM6848559.1 MucBP domain-containing protein [Lactococcus lactis]MCM6850687.1 MucBP domain-containing protein [Lactococcus lactis]MCM6858422.1 MucBP domain-containing protein [Lactococcus lactis]
MIIKNKMVKRLISTFLMSLLLASMMLVIGAGKVYAQVSVSSTSLQVSADGSDYYIIGSDFYNHFVRPTTVDLAKNKVVYNKQILTVYNGRIDKWKMSFLNQDSSGKSWFKFLSYPEATKGDIKITYTTDGINYSDSKPSLEQLKGYMVELLKPIVYPDDANNQENDIEVSFQLSPDTDYILSNSNLNKQFIPFSGEYWLQNYSPYPFFTDRNQLQFVYPDYSKGVMVKYVDEEGNEIHDPQTISGSKGDVYDASTDQYKLVLDGYTLDTSKLPQNSIGNFKEALQTVTYVYSKNPVVAADVTVRYVDIENNPISEDIILQGNIGENYYTDKKNIKDYTLKEVQGNSSGQFSEKAQTVTYIYKKNELPIATGKVVVKYIDTDGKSILNDVVRTGTVGEDYITEEKNISGYTFQGIRGNSKGKYTDKIQTITYVYTKNHIIKPKDELVNSGTKIINKTNPKVKNSSSEKSQKLPETGENKKRSILFFISGLTLITLGSTIIVFRHKKE